MQIHYCYQCNSRVDSDDAVTVDEKVYCKKCADGLSADDYLVRTEGLPPARFTPSRGIQRLTPTKAGRKTPTKIPMSSPPRGSATTHSGKTPIRGSKHGMKPASPAKGTAIRPATPSKGHPIRRTPTKSVPPASVAHSTTNAGESANEPHSTSDSRKVRAASSSAMVWGLAIVALLLIAAACILMIFGNHVSESNTQPEKNSTSTQSGEKK